VAIYRFDLFDRKTKALRTLEFDLENDTASLVKALDMRDGVRIDVWSESRWVASVGQLINGKLPHKD
jgi:hypothetical protein